MSPETAYDTIVIGLGGMGSATAYQLALRGRKVLGLEQYGPAHAEGSSHGSSRIIRQAYFEDPSYVPLLLRAYELWEQLERETGKELMTLTGGLMVGAPDGGLVSGSVRSAEEHGLPYEMLDAADLHRRFPAFDPDPETVALYEERAGFVRPEASVSAHLDRATALGADLRFGEPVVSWEDSEDRVIVETGAGTYEAGSMVLSVGAWASRLLPDLRLPLEVTRQVMYWFEPERKRRLFLPPLFPIFIWEPEDGNMFYGFPAQDGETGVKAAFFRADGVPCAPETIDREVGDEETDFLQGYLSRYVPAMSGELLDARTCMYTNTPDQHFIVSQHPEHPRVSIAAGFSGHGYKFCSVMGEVLADLATEGETRHPISLFSPERLSSSTPREQ